MEIKHEVSAGCIPFRFKDGKKEYLLTQHTAGHWAFPKGRMEPGETYAETAKREMYEETGILSNDIFQGYFISDNIPFKTEVA